MRAGRTRLAIARHLLMSNYASYEQILKAIKARGDIWTVSQGEYVHWWQERACASMKVTVNNDPVPPTAAAGGDQNVTEGAMVTLTGSGTDDDTVASYLWEEVTTSGVTLSGANTAEATFTAPDVDADGETLTFRLTVTDNDGLTATDTVDVSVSDVSAVAPNANAGDDQTDAPVARS